MRSTKTRGEISIFFLGGRFELRQPLSKMTIKDSLLSIIIPLLKPKTNNSEYWTLVMDVARKNNLKRILRCSQIMGEESSF